jgi:hypothetical protein
MIIPARLYRLAAAPIKSDLAVIWSQCREVRIGVI